MTFDVRNLTEAERAQLSQLLAPYLEEKQQAERLIAAIGMAFLTALGFPSNVRVNLDTGEVTRRPATPVIGVMDEAVPAPRRS